MEKRIKEYELARLILRLSNQIVKNRDQHVRDLGLTTEQADSLQFFLSHKNAVIMDLKEHLGVTHQTARGIVQRMEIKGLIETKKSEIVLPPAYASPGAGTRAENKKQSVLPLKVEKGKRRAAAQAARPPYG